MDQICPNDGVELEQIGPNAGKDNQTRAAYEFPEYPKVEEERVGFFNKLFFHFLDPVLKKGAKEQLQIDDLAQVCSFLRTRPVLSEFDHLWGAERTRNSANPSLVKVYWRLSKARVSTIAPFILLYAVMPLVAPYLMAWGLEALGRNEPWIGFAYICGMALVNFTATVLGGHAYRMMWQIAIKVNAANIAMMYRKSLRLSNTSRQSITQGEIMNLISTDTQTVFNFSVYFVWMFATPLQMIGGVILLYERVQYSLFAGLGAMVVAAPFFAVLGMKFETLATKKQKAGDTRLKLVQDMLNGIKLVRFSGWEDSLKRRISKMRATETSIVFKYLMTIALFGASFGVLPVLAVMAVFATFAAVNGAAAMTAPLVFSTLNLLDLIRVPLAILPMLLSMGFTASVSAGRIKEFLMMEERAIRAGDGDAAGTGTRIGAASGVFDGLDDDVLAVIRNGDFAWQKQKLKKTGVDDKVKEKGEEKEGNTDEHAKELDMESKGMELDRDRDMDKGNPDADSQPEVEIVAALKNVDFSVARGELVMVVSPVGGGKSTLISALLGEVDCTSTSAEPGAVSGVGVRGTVAIVEQKPWLASMTVKENILAGARARASGGACACACAGAGVNRDRESNSETDPDAEVELKVDEDRLAMVVAACALEEDLDSWPAGLDTEIGERGLNLSGGQVARVALARAVYADADIYLLDDVLSAVDAHVSRHIFDHVLNPLKGMLKDKAVILTTNQLQFLAFSHRVVVLNSRGEMAETGRFDDLMAHGLDFSALIKSHANDIRQRRQGSAPDSPTASLKLDESGAKDTTLELSSGSEANVAPAGDGASAVADTDADAGKLVEDEVRHAGAVPTLTYKRFAAAGGGLAFIIVFLLLSVVATASIYLASVWLAVWTSGTLFPGAGLEFYLGGYALVFTVGVCFQIVLSVVFARGFTKAVKITHDEMLNSVIHAPMRWFETTPTGRIINRFSKDMFQVDMEAPPYLQALLNGVLLMVLALVVAGSIAPAVFIVIVPAAYLFYTAQEYFRRSSREVQRLDSVTKSHVMTHFSESVSGYTALHAFDLVDLYMRALVRKVDQNHRAYYIAKIAQRWLSVRASAISAVLVIGMGVVLALFSSTIGPSFAGLALAMLNGIVPMLEDYVEVVAETEMRFVSVERAHEYTDLETESTDGQPIEEGWPSGGGIEFSNVSMRYRDELPLVLHEVSFDVKPGEKLGIVGRTGSCKSTLAVLLFRIVEAASGHITVDGVEISKIRLVDLRHHLTIIPQQPVMFEGTVRFNLDPFDEYSDADIWTALETVQLKSVVGNLPEKLEAPVREGGANYSVGQRQLICFARALLRKPRILVLDEATASVDVATDAIIQVIVRKMFRGATVITIAHRLNTIMDSNRVLVMDGGRVKEHDAPLHLLDDADSLFAALCRETGKQNSLHLRDLAEKAHVNVANRDAADAEELARMIVEMENMENEAGWKEAQY